MVFGQWSFPTSANLTDRIGASGACYSSSVWWWFILKVKCWCELAWETMSPTISDGIWRAFRVTCRIIRTLKRTDFFWRTPDTGDRNPDADGVYRLEMVRKCYPMNCDLRPYLGLTCTTKESEKLVAFVLFAMYGTYEAGNFTSCLPTLYGRYIPRLSISLTVSGSGQCRTSWTGSMGFSEVSEGRWKPRCWGSLT